MGHIHTDLIIRGTKGDKEIRDILVDTGATRTILPEEALQEVGAQKLPPPGERKITLELGDGREVGVECYLALLRIEDREHFDIVYTFEGAKPVIGVLTLETLGFSVHPVTSTLKPTRPKGVAYFYRHFG